MESVYQYSSPDFPKRYQHHNCRFGQKTYVSLFTSPVTLALPNGTSLVFEVSIIDLQVPFLLGLDELGRYGITLDFETGYMSAGDSILHLNFHCVGDHAFVLPDNPNSIRWTRAEFQKLHLHFYHPSSDNLFNVLRRVRPEDTPCAVLDILKQISGACATCQELHASPFRFRVSLPEYSLRFNAKAVIDLVWSDKRPVLHVVDAHTCFQNASFIRDKTAECLWKLFIEVWATVYCGLPDVLRVDREPSLMASAFRKDAEGCDVVLQSSPIEAHNAIGVG